MSAADLTISELARKAGVNVETIRYYERLGLIPAPQRDAGGRRRYGADMIGFIGFIREAKCAGLSLDDVGTLMQSAASGNTNAAERLLRKLDERMDAIQAVRKALANFAFAEADTSPGGLLARRCERCGSDTQ